MKPLARVVLTSTLANRFAGGRHEFQVEASSVRQLIRDLELRFPGLGKEIEQAAALAIDGEIYQDPFMERLADETEVFVLPKIGGG